MTETTDKKGPVRVSPRVRKWVDERQKIEHYETGVMPSHPQLFDRLFDAYEKAQEGVQRPSPIAAQPSKKFERLAPEMTPEQRERAEWHKLLDVILDHGDEGDVTGIQRNLIWGSRDVKKRRPKTGNG